MNFSKNHLFIMLLSLIAIGAYAKPDENNRFLFNAKLVGYCTFLPALYHWPTRGGEFINRNEIIDAVAKERLFDVKPFISSLAPIAAIPYSLAMANAFKDYKDHNDGWNNNRDFPGFSKYTHGLFAIGHATSSIAALHNIVFCHKANQAGLMPNISVLSYDLFHFKNCNKYLGLSFLALTAKNMYQAFHAKY